MGRKIALLIGNNNYNDSKFSQLVTPTEDVQGLEEVLSDPRIGGFDHVQSFINQPEGIIRREIARFFLVEKKRDDLLLLYYSGHGSRDDSGRLYLAAKDTEHDLMEGSAIAATYITDLINRSDSRRQVLILDCCYSGAFADGSKSAVGMGVDTERIFKGTGYGRWVMTATDAIQLAWQGDQKLGELYTSVFTRYLVKGLRTGEADSNGNGEITLDELYDYIYEHVVRETSEQQPRKWTFNQQGSGSIVIAQAIVKTSQFSADKQAIFQANDTVEVNKNRVRSLFLSSFSDEELTNYIDAQTALDFFTAREAESVKARAVALIGWYKYEPAVPMLINYLLSIAPDIDQHVAHTYFGYNDMPIEIIGHVSDDLFQWSNKLTYQVLHALKEFKVSEALNGLIDFFLQVCKSGKANAEQIKIVTNEVMKSLGKTEKAHVLQLLEEALRESSDEAFILSGAIAISQIGGDRAQEVLNKLLQSEQRIWAQDLYIAVLKEIPHDLTPFRRRQIEYSSREINNLIVLYVGNELSSLFQDNMKDILRRIDDIRARLLKEQEIELPVVRLKYNESLKDNEYLLLIYYRIVLQGFLHSNFVILKPEADLGVIEGIETTEPAYKSPLVWVLEDSLPKVKALGYKMFSGLDILMDNLEYCFTRYNHTMILLANDTDSVSTQNGTG